MDGTHRKCVCSCRSAAIVLLLFYMTVTRVAASSHPRGHLQPLGSHQPPEGKIVEVEGASNPAELCRESMHFSRPVVLRRAIEKCRAMELWNDQYLR